MSKLVLENEMGCSCSPNMDNNGYGRCRRKDSNMGNRYTCYVNQPSNCPDLVDSTTYTGQQFSAEACYLQGKLHLFI